MIFDYVYIGDENGQPRTDQIKRLPDMAYIPNNSANSDWIAYQAWLMAGNTPHSVGYELSLGERKSRCLEKLTDYRNNLMYGGFSYNSNVYNSDKDSQFLMSSAMAQSERGFPVFPVNWILHNGSVLQMSYDDMKALSGAMAAYIQLCYSNYVTLMTAIVGSDNPESIDITQGWPSQS
jgi:hypothetical protein